MFDLEENDVLEARAGKNAGVSNLVSTCTSTNAPEVDNTSDIAKVFSEGIHHLQDDHENTANDKSSPEDHHTAARTVTPPAPPSLSSLRPIYSLRELANLHENALLAAEFDGATPSEDATSSNELKHRGYYLCGRVAAVEEKTGSGTTSTANGCNDAVALSKAPQLKTAGQIAKPGRNKAAASGASSAAASRAGEDMDKKIRNAGGKQAKVNAAGSGVTEDSAAIVAATQSSGSRENIATTFLFEDLFGDLLQIIIYETGTNVAPLPLDAVAQQDKTRTDHLARPDYSLNVNASRGKNDVGLPAREVSAPGAEPEVGVADKRKEDHDKPSSRRNNEKASKRSKDKEKRTTETSTSDTKRGGSGHWCQLREDENKYPPGTGLMLLEPLVVSHRCADDDDGGPPDEVNTAASGAPTPIEAPTFSGIRCTFTVKIVLSASTSTSSLPVEHKAEAQAILSWPAFPKDIRDWIALGQKFEQQYFQRPDPAGQGNQTDKNDAETRDDRSFRYSLYSDLRKKDLTSPGNEAELALLCYRRAFASIPNRIELSSCYASYGYCFYQSNHLSAEAIRAALIACVLDVDSFRAWRILADILRAKNEAVPDAIVNLLGEFVTNFVATRGFFASSLSPPSPTTRSLIPPRRTRGVLENACCSEDFYDPPGHPFFVYLESPSPALRAKRKAWDRGTGTLQMFKNFAADVKEEAVKELCNLSFAATVALPGVMDVFERQRQEVCQLEKNNNDNHKTSTTTERATYQEFEAAKDQAKSPFRRHEFGAETQRAYARLLFWTKEMVETAKHCGKVLCLESNMALKVVKDEQARMEREKYFDESEQEKGLDMVRFALLQSCVAALLDHQNPDPWVLQIRCLEQLGAQCALLRHGPGYSNMGLRLTRKETVGEWLTSSALASQLLRPDGPLVDFLHRLFPTNLFGGGGMLNHSVGATDNSSSSAGKSTISIRTKTAVFRALENRDALGEISSKSWEVVETSTNLQTTSTTAGADSNMIHEDTAKADLIQLDLESDPGGVVGSTPLASSTSAGVLAGISSTTAADEVGGPASRHPHRQNAAFQPQSSPGVSPSSSAAASTSQTTKQNKPDRTTAAAAGRDKQDKVQQTTKANPPPALEVLPIPGGTTGVEVLPTTKIFINPGAEPRTPAGHRRTLKKLNKLNAKVLKSSDTQKFIKAAGDTLKQILISGYNRKPNMLEKCLAFEALLAYVTTKPEDTGIDTEAIFRQSRHFSDEIYETHKALHLEFLAHFKHKIARGFYGNGRIGGFLSDTKSPGTTPYMDDFARTGSCNPCEADLVRHIPPEDTNFRQNNPVFAASPTFFFEKLLYPAFFLGFISPWKGAMSLCTGDFAMLWRDLHFDEDLVEARWLNARNPMLGEVMVSSTERIRIMDKLALWRKALQPVVVSTTRYGKTKKESAAIAHSGSIFGINHDPVSTSSGTAAHTTSSSDLYTSPESGETTTSLASTARDEESTSQLVSSSSSGSTTSSSTTSSPPKMLLESIKGVRFLDRMRNRERAVKARIPYGFQVVKDVFAEAEQVRAAAQMSYKSASKGTEVVDHEKALAEEEEMELDLEREDGLVCNRPVSLYTDFRRHPWDTRGTTGNKITLVQGTTHVQVGFLDFQELMNAKILGGETTSTFSESCEQSPDGKKTTTSGSSPSCSPGGLLQLPHESERLKFVGICYDAYTVAKFTVIQFMLLSEDTPLEHVLQVWYSSMWTFAALESFIAHCRVAIVVLSAKRVVPPEGDEEEPEKHQSAKTTTTSAKSSSGNKKNQNAKKLSFEAADDMVGDPSVLLFLEKWLATATEQPVTPTEAACTWFNNVVGAEMSSVIGRPVPYDRVSEDLLAYLRVVEKQTKKKSTGVPFSTHACTKFLEAFNAIPSFKSEANRVALVHYLLTGRLVPGEGMDRVAAGAKTSSTDEDALGGRGLVDVEEVDKQEQSGTSKKTNNEGQKQKSRTKQQGRGDDEPDVLDTNVTSLFLGNITMFRANIVAGLEKNLNALTCLSIEDYIDELARDDAGRRLEVDLEQHQAEQVDKSTEISRKRPDTTTSPSSTRKKPKTALCDPTLLRKQYQKRAAAGEIRNIVQLFIRRTLRQLQSLRRSLLSRKVQVFLHYRTHDEWSRRNDLADFIATYNPATVSWTNEVDRYPLDAFHELARRASRKPHQQQQQQQLPTTHYAYSLNWIGETFGACLTDFLALPDPNRSTDQWDRYVRARQKPQEERGERDENSDEAYLYQQDPETLKKVRQILACCCSENGFLYSRKGHRTTSSGAALSYDVEPPAKNAAETSNNARPALYAEAETKLHSAVDDEDVEDDEDEEEPSGGRASNGPTPVKKLPSRMLIPPRRQLHASGQVAKVLLDHYHCALLSTPLRLPALSLCRYVLQQVTCASWVKDFFCKKSKHIIAHCEENGLNLLSPLSTSSSHQLSFSWRYFSAEVAGAAGAPGATSSAIVFPWTKEIVIEDKNSSSSSTPAPAALSSSSTPTTTLVPGENIEAVKETSTAPTGENGSAGDHQVVQRVVDDEGNIINNTANKSQTDRCTEREALAFASTPDENKTDETPDARGREEQDDGGLLDQKLVAAGGASEAVGAAEKDVEQAEETLLVHNPDMMIFHDEDTSKLSKHALKRKRRALREEEERKQLAEDAELTAKRLALAKRQYEHARSLERFVTDHVLVSKKRNGTIFEKDKWMRAAQRCTSSTEQDEEPSEAQDSSSSFFVLDPTRGRLELPPTVLPWLLPLLNRPELQVFRPGSSDPIGLPEGLETDMEMVDILFNFSRMKADVQPYYLFVKNLLEQKPETLMALACTNAQPEMVMQRWWTDNVEDHGAIQIGYAAYQLLEFCHTELNGQLTALTDPMLVGSGKRKFLGYVFQNLRDFSPNVLKVAAKAENKGSTSADGTAEDPSSSSDHAISQKPSVAPTRDTRLPGEGHGDLPPHRPWDTRPGCGQARRPVEICEHTTHVQVGFLDFQELMSAKFVPNEVLDKRAELEKMEAAFRDVERVAQRSSSTSGQKERSDEQNRENLDVKNHLQEVNNPDIKTAEASKNSSTEQMKNGPSRPQTRFVGYCHDLYTLAKFLVISKMLDTESCPIDHVIQVWYSSVWTLETFASFAAACQAVVWLIQSPYFVGPPRTPEEAASVEEVESQRRRLFDEDIFEGKYNHNHENLLCDILAYWSEKATPVLLPDVHRQWFDEVTCMKNFGCFDTVACFRRAIDHEALLHYFLSGNLFPELTARTALDRLYTLKEPARRATLQEILKGQVELVKGPTYKLAEMKINTGRTNDKAKAGAATSSPAQKSPVPIREKGSTFLFGNVTMFIHSSDEEILPVELMFRDMTPLQRNLNALASMSLDDYVQEMKLNERDLGGSTSSAKKSEKNLLQLFLSATRRKLSNLRTLMREDKLCVTLRQRDWRRKPIDAEDIGALRPKSISWTNEMDRYRIADFHKIAKASEGREGVETSTSHQNDPAGSCTDVLTDLYPSVNPRYGEACFHFGYSTKWVLETFGAHILDFSSYYMHLPGWEKLLEMNKTEDKVEGLEQWQREQKQIQHEQLRAWIGQAMRIPTELLPKEGDGNEEVLEGKSKKTGKDLSFRPGTIAELVELPLRLPGKDLVNRKLQESVKMCWMQDFEAKAPKDYDCTCMREDLATHVSPLTLQDRYAHQEGDGSTTNTAEELATGGHFSSLFLEWVYLGKVGEAPEVEAADEQEFKSVEEEKFSSSTDADENEKTQQKTE
ncbi:unnamed protein product [Amoebophrya sp. A120]|nr:unnamed protein product [Amoebophrya sp. A120]|eukprot:GSA120T00016171001.1